MPGKKRCFVSVLALKRFDENLLCAVLGKVPDHLRDRALVLPDPPDQDAVDYEAIRDACMSGDIPAELDDVLYFVSILGNKRGQEQIEREARFRKRRLDFRLDGVGCTDFAMKAWLHEWPRNRDRLEAAYARDGSATTTTQSSVMRADTSGSRPRSGSWRRAWVGAAAQPIPGAKRAPWTSGLRLPFPASKGRTASSDS